MAAPGRLTVAADAGLTCDVVEFCFLLGGRRDPAAVDVAATGDRGLVDALMAAAPLLSGP